MGADIFFIVGLYIDLDNYFVWIRAMKTIMDIPLSLNLRNFTPLCVRMTH